MGPLMTKVSQRKSGIAETQNGTQGEVRWEGCCYLCMGINEEEYGICVYKGVTMYYCWLSIECLHHVLE